MRVIMPAGPVCYRTLCGQTQRWLRDRSDARRAAEGLRPLPRAGALGTGIAVMRVGSVFVALEPPEAGDHGT
jgi:hypothetical protein